MSAILKISKVIYLIGGFYLAYHLMVPLNVRNSVLRYRILTGSLQYGGALFERV